MFYHKYNMTFRKNQYKKIKFNYFFKKQLTNLKFNVKLIIESKILIEILKNKGKKYEENYYDLRSFGGTCTHMCINHCTK